MHWLTAAAPLAILIGIGALAVLFRVLRPRTHAVLSREILELQLTVLGPVSRREVAMVVVLVLVVIGWLLAPTLHIDPGT